MSNPIPCGDDFDVCPFCGVRPTIEPWHGGAKTKRMVACSNDDCDVQPQVTGETNLLARDKWNRRAPSVHSEEFPDLRDQMAMAAMTRLIVDPARADQSRAECARLSYLMADAMMEARRSK